MPDVYFNRDKNKNNKERGNKNPGNGTSNAYRPRNPRGEPPRFDNRGNGNYRQAPQQPQNVQPVKQRHPWRTFLIIVLVLVLLYVSVAQILFHGMDVNKKQHKRNQYISDLRLKSSPRVYNILLLGVDRRDNEEISRSDTMMLLSIDRAHREIKLSSFLRDSYVEIPDHGMNKLNAACTEGGVQLVIDTIEYNYQVKIDKYMAVDFKAFEAVIDSLGGVDVPVTVREANYLNRTWYKWSLSGNRIQFESGDSVHMDGEHALMFCRIRKLDSDVERTRRQRLVISAVKDKLTSASVGEILDAVQGALPYVETDLTPTRVLNLSVNAGLRYKNYDVYSKSFPASGTYRDASTNAGSSLVFDIDENATILQEFIYKDASDAESSSDSDSLF